MACKVSSASARRRRSCAIDSMDDRFIAFSASQGARPCSARALPPFHSTPIHPSVRNPQQARRPCRACPSGRLARILHTPIETAAPRRVRSRGLQPCSPGFCRPGPLTVLPPPTRPPAPPPALPPPPLLPPPTPPH